MPSQNSVSTLTLTPMSRAEAAALVDRLLGSYPSASLADPEIYITAVISLLAAYPLWAGERAVRKVVETLKFVPTIAEVKPILEETVRVRRYAAEWEHEAGLLLASRTKLLEGPREQRMTYDELKAKYGPNWGIGGAEAKPVETAEQARDKLVAIAGQEAFDACPAAGYDPRKTGAWRGLTAPPPRPMEAESEDAA